MNLRLDHLLHELHTRQAEILAAIDADPLLIRRSSGPLTLANAGSMLFTPRSSTNFTLRELFTAATRSDWSRCRSSRSTTSANGT